MANAVAPVIDGWFTTGDEPSLLGTRCRTCGSAFFPRETTFCRNPACDGEDLDEVELPRRGRVWSYTDARYQPPPPYIARSDPYEPFAIAAVELEGEGMVVLGQVADGYGVDDLAIGTEVELVVEPLYADAATDTTYLTWRWRPLSERPFAASASERDPAKSERGPSGPAPQAPRAGDTA